jgi:hypothetical protein
MESKNSGNLSERENLRMYWDFIKQKCHETYGTVNDQTLLCFCRNNVENIRYVDFKAQLEHRF